MGSGIGYSCPESIAESTLRGFCQLNGAIKIERKKEMNECRSAIVTEAMLMTKIMFIVLESY